MFEGLRVKLGGMSGRVVKSLQDAVRVSVVEEKLSYIGADAREVDSGRVRIDKW